MLKTSLKFIISTILISTIAQNASANDRKKQIEILCQQWDLQQSSTNQVAGAAYVPGVDVHGKPVKQANVNTSQEVIDLYPIRIPIEIDILQKYNISVPEDLSLTPQIAEIIIQKNGDIMLGERKVSQSIEKLCKDHRQKNNNPLISADSKKLIEPNPTPDYNDEISGQHP